MYQDTQSLHNNIDNVISVLSGKLNYNSSASMFEAFAELVRCKVELLKLEQEN